MSNVSDIEKGETILMESRPYHGNRRGEPRVQNVVVTRVGREYIYVQERPHSIELKFRRSTGLGISDEHSSGCELFNDLVVYEQIAGRRNREREASVLLHGNAVYQRNWKALSDDELATITTLLKKLNGETP